MEKFNQKMMKVMLENGPYVSVLIFWKIKFETFSKYQAGKFFILVYFELDFYCLCSQFIELEFAN